MMKALNARLVLSLSAVLLVGGAVYSQSNPCGNGTISKIAQPLEDAATSVSEGAQQAANFGSFLPGSFK